jgi:hypothetical protein
MARHPATRQIRITVCMHEMDSRGGTGSIQWLVVLARSDTRSLNTMFICERIKGLAHSK